MQFEGQHRFERGLLTQRTGYLRKHWAEGSWSRQNQN